MYKMLDFPLSIFQYLNGLVLCISTCSFQKSQWKNFLDPCHVIKLDFHEKNSVKRPFNHLRNRAQLSHCSSCILHKISFNLKKKLNSGKFGNKSNGHFTISLPVKIFVNRRKNYHFVILFEPNHKSTLVSI